MSRDTLRRLLDAGLRDPRTGEAVRVPTRSVAIEESLEGREAELVLELGLGPRLAVVSDPETERVLGRRVRQALSAPATGLRVRPVLLPAHPRPDARTAEALRRESREAAALIAVGFGTINDLCKYAAALDGKPYAVFGTAPSMNGYTSVNASITVGGIKKSLPAAGASGVFLDLRVLAADSGLLERFAPARPR